MSHAQYQRPVSGWAVPLMRIIFIAALLVLTYNSLRPAAAIGSIENVDKLLHAAAYFLLTVLFGLAFPKLRLFWVLCLLCLYGGVMEIAQGSMSSGRSGSVHDMLANLFGALAAIVMWWIFIRFVRNDK